MKSVLTALIFFPVLLYSSVETENVVLHKFYKDNTAAQQWFAVFVVDGEPERSIDIPLREGTTNLNARNLITLLSNFPRRELEKPQLDVPPMGMPYHQKKPDGILKFRIPRKDLEPGFLKDRLENWEIIELSHG